MTTTETPAEVWHSCSCGRSFRWALDLWEHVVRSGHEATWDR